MIVVHPEASAQSLESCDIIMDLLDISLDRIRAACDWLGRSQDVTRVGGSSASYSPLSGWAPAYPETTGYICATLWRASNLLNDPSLARRAQQMADWLLSLQDTTGWFPGGTWTKSSTPKPSVFNTGQIVFGLVETARRTGDTRYADAARRAVAWLSNVQEPDGTWRIGAYRSGHVPSYYAHVAWPVAEYAKYANDDRAATTARRALVRVHADRNPNGTYAAWAFAPNKPAFTHTIAYTLQGVIETALLLDDWRIHGESAAESATTLMRKAEMAGGLAGAYHTDWKPVSWYVCLTGNCQMASTWMRLYERDADLRYLNAASRALETVARHQRMRPARPDVHGAIAGSAPLIGRYMTLRYPNWTAKFFVDAMSDIRGHLGKLAGL